MENNGSDEARNQTGLIASLLSAIRNFFALAISRIELAALELTEIRTNIFKVLLLCACGIITIWFALIGWSALIVVLAWPTLGWKILAIIAAVFSVLAFASFWYARAIVKRGGLSMPATMAELRADRDALL